MEDHHRQQARQWLDAEVGPRMDAIYRGLEALDTPTLEAMREDVAGFTEGNVWWALFVLKEFLLYEIGVELRNRALRAAREPLQAAAPE